MVRERKVDSDLVLDGALDLLDERGLAGFSMRLLARRLGVKAPSLYEYFSGKDEVLTAVCDYIVTFALKRSNFGQGLHMLRAFPLQLRSVLYEHPGVASVIASRPISPSLAEELQPMLGQLSTELGWSAQQLEFGIQSIYVFVAGHALAEHGDPPAVPTASRQYYDDWFEFGLGALLKGLEEL